MVNSLSLDTSESGKCAGSNFPFSWEGQTPQGELQRHGGGEEFGLPDPPKDPH